MSLNGRTPTIEPTRTPPGGALLPRWRRTDKGELRRLSGLFDGEGCVTASLTNQNRLTVRVSVSMTTRAEVASFARAFGGKVGKYASRKANTKPFYVWSEGNGAAVEVLEFIVEHCRLKRRAAVPALRLARDMRATPSGRAIDAGRKAWRLEQARQIVAAVGRRPGGFDPDREARYLRGRTYSGLAVVASDGRRFASLAAAAAVVGTTRTAICTAVRRGKACRGVMWSYADPGAAKPDDAATARAAFSAALHALRAERGLTVSDVARAVGVTPQACDGWSRGETLPSASNLRRLVRLFGAAGAALAESLRAADAERTHRPAGGAKLGSSLL